MNFGRVKSDSVVKPFEMSFLCHDFVTFDASMKFRGIITAHSGICFGIFRLEFPQFPKSSLFDSSELQCFLGIRHNGEGYAA